MYVAGHLIENKYAGEIGHIDVGSGEPCACGAHGCLEATASGAAIAARYSRMSGGSAAGADEVVKLMRPATVWQRSSGTTAVDALARALATYTSLLAPELVVIGGGMSGAGETLLEPLRRRLQEHLVWQQMPRIVAAHLGENAACLGAGLLARQAIAPGAAGRSSIARLTKDKDEQPCATP